MSHVETWCVVIIFAVFGAFLGIFCMLGEVPRLQFNLDVFLNEYGVVFLFGVLIYRAAQNVLQIAMRGM